MTDNSMVFGKPSSYKNINSGRTITMVKKSVEIAGKIVYIAKN